LLHFIWVTDEEVKVILIIWGKIIKMNAKFNSLKYGEKVNFLKLALKSIF